MNKKVSCIICAYNEEGRICKVLKAVAGHPLVSEVIVIDDCSKDGTVKEVLEFKDVKLVRHKKNLGKTNSMKDGCTKAKNKLVMFIDADLVGLTRNNISNLIKPVTDGSVDISISMRKNSLLLYKVLGIDFVSGERVIKRDIVKKILKTVSGYGIEVKINKYVLENNLKFLVVKWPNVSQTRKQKKEGFIKGWFHDLVMLKQILQVVSFPELIKQLYVMSLLSARYKREIKNEIHK